MSTSVRTQLVIGADLSDLVITESIETPTFDKYTGQPNGVEVSSKEFLVLGKLKINFLGWGDVEYEVEMQEILKNSNLELIKLDSSDSVVPNVVLGISLFNGDNWENESRAFTFEEIRQAYLKVVLTIHTLYNECGIAEVPDIKIIVHGGASN